MTITLRPLRPADADVMAGWFADAVALAEWAGPDIDFPLTAAHVATWVAETSGGRPRACYATLDAQGAIDGTFQLVHDARNRTVRIARFAIAPEARGAGYGKALLALMLAMAFDEFGAHRVELAVSTGNPRARRLYERAGFVHEGTMRDSSFVDGAWRSADAMSLLRPEWRRGWADAPRATVLLKV
jgi:RimJ/RimL family protein N-acetyltransferase